MLQKVVDINRAKKTAMRTGANFKQDMRAGNGPPNCGTCPPGVNDVYGLAAARGQTVAPGQYGDCRWTMLPLTGTILAAGPRFISLSVANSPIGLCVERIVALVDGGGVPVQFSDLTFGNTNQWIIGQAYDQNLFRPDGRCAACCLPMQCIAANSAVSVTVTAIPDAAADADIQVRFYLIGPGIGV